MQILEGEPNPYIFKDDLRKKVTGKLKLVNILGTS